MAEEPIEQYTEDVKKGVIDPVPYERLMVHYRKEKNYDEELKVIKKAIATFKKYFADRPTSKKKGKVAELSKIFSKKAGLTDKKGNEIYLPEPLPKWVKRQATVEQKLGRKKAKA